MTFLEKVKAAGNRFNNHPEVKYFNDKKVEAVDLQNFEDAANWREKERDLIVKLYDREQKLNKINGNTTKG